MQSTDAVALVPAETYISDLIIGKRGQVFEAMVYRKWIAKSLPEMTETDFVCMLIDVKGNAVHATMDRNNLTYFDDLLVIGQVYMISRFSCHKTSTYQQSIQNPITLRFGKMSRFDLLEGKNDGWPQHYFEFLPFRELSSRVPYKDTNQKTVYPLLTDYIGRIRYIGDIPPAGDVTRSKGLRRKIDIENLDGTFIELTLWDDTAARFPKDFTDSLPAPVIMAVSSCRVINYRGALQLSAMPATHYYVNQNTPDFATLKSAFQDKFKTTPPLHVSKKPFGPSYIEGPSHIQTLEALLRHPPSGFKGVNFIVQATITGVIQNSSWYYVSCSQCKKPPLPYDDVYECEDHGELEGPSFRYNFGATVHDGTTAANFTFFSPAGDEATGHPCSLLATKYINADRRIVPHEITSIVGRRHTFQIQFNASSATGSGRFNVVAVLDKETSSPILAIEGTSQQKSVTVEAIETSKHTSDVGTSTGTPEDQKLDIGVTLIVGSIKDDASGQAKHVVDKLAVNIVAEPKQDEHQPHKRPIRRSILPQLQEDAKKAKEN